MVPHSHTALKIVSVAYLLYLAWKIGTASGLGEKSVIGKPITFLQAAAFQWVNPKAWSMALTAVTVYAANQSLQAVALAALFSVSSVCPRPPYGRLLATS